MTPRQSQIVLVLLAAVYLAALVLLAPRLELIGDESLAADVQLAAAGLVFAPPALLALWAMLGRQRAAVRLPLAGWMFAAFFLAAAYGEIRNYGHGYSGFILLAGVAWLVASAGLLLSVRLLRAVRGWRLERAADSRPEPTTTGDGRTQQRQFTLRTLLAWTFAIALLCAGARRLAPYSSYLDASPIELLAAESLEGAIIGLLVALAGIPVLSVAFILLADGRRLVLRTILAVITVAGIAAAKTIFERMNDDEMMGRLVLMCEAGVVAAALFAVSIMRACGLRLVRRPRRGVVSDLPPAVPFRRGRLVYASALLGTAATILSVYAPARFEIWRRGDETQRWASLGWQVGFDDDGRITAATSNAEHDLSGSEFQLAELHDLTSLDFTHALLTDVQFAQFRLQNPALASLQSLNLNGTHVGDATAGELAKFPKLTDLNLSGTNVTDGGVASLAPLKKLTALNLSGTDISDDGLSAIAQLPGLQVVNLALTAVSAAGAKQLQASLPGATITYGASDAVLKDMSTRRITMGGGMMAIAAAPTMWKHLHLRGNFVEYRAAGQRPAATAVTDAGLALLTSQSILEELDLRESAVTDAGLTALTKLKSLKRLDLRGTGVTEQGCAQFAKALPDCEIVR